MRWKPESAQEYVLNRIQRVERVAWLGECWEWKLARYDSTQGYGAARQNGKQDRAHRVSYRAFVGEIPDGTVVCHKCNNPACVNPTHLYAGTVRQNMDDMIAHGVHRARSPRRAGHACAKLSEDDVAAILEAASRNETCESIGARFGVSRTAVCRITRNRNWADGRAPMLERGRGANNHTVKYSVEKVDAARAALDSGKTIREAAGLSGLSWGVVQKIRAGTHWTSRTERQMDSNHVAPGGAQ